MSARTVPNQSAVFSDFEFVEGDLEQLSNILVSSSQKSPWIDPAAITLRHRIGRGPFGDVWLATLQGAQHYEYHEVAIKMLPSVNENNMSVALNRLCSMFSKCRGLETVCLLQGISVKNGKLCLVMKFYESSIGDKMARLKGGKLPMHDVLRYGADLARGIMELHSKDILILNLKPCNFLLNENDHAVLGDIGIPYLLFGIPLLSSDTTRRIGTPNYMAPEQWQPEIRGPISSETDSWGFGCSFIEMLTGIQPWSGKSADEIYKLVVRKQEKPHIPSNLPPAVEHVIVGCFEYDFRKRPLMVEILQVLKSSLNAVFHDGNWLDLGIGMISEKSSGSGYSNGFLLKDHLQVGDTVRSRKTTNSWKPENMEVPEGTVVGIECDADRNGYVLVRVHGIHDPIRVRAFTLERVTFGLAAGDWVRLKTAGNKHSKVGILHAIDRDGGVTVGFIGLETLWKGSCSELHMAEAYAVGQFIRLRSDVFSPRFEWPPKRGCEWAVGRICQVLPNGCLVVKFPGRLTFDDENSNFLADPAEVEVVSFSTSPGMIKKFQHFEDLHWAIRPLTIVLGLFAAMKFGIFVGKKIGLLKGKRGRNPVIQGDGQYVDGQSGGNGKWIHPKVANIIFKEGVNTTTSR